MLALLMLPTLARAADQDMDGFSDQLDNCPTVWNQKQLDYDKDDVGDTCEICEDPKTGQVYSGSDTEGSATVAGDHDSCQSATLLKEILCAPHSWSPPVRVTCFVGRTKTGTSGRLRALPLESLGI